MKIKKFIENYKIDYESEDISEEYCKLIICNYIDDLNDSKTLQDSFDYYCRELESDLRYIVSQKLLDIIYNIYGSRKIQYTDDYFIKKDAKKYNL